MGDSKRINRPQWHSGTLLVPQLFQQQAAWEASTNEQVARLARVHPWGITSLAFDQHALGLGQLLLSELDLRLPDGQRINSLDTDLLPPALSLSASPFAHGDCKLIVLALPLYRADGSNSRAQDAPAAPPGRYRQDWRTVQDQHGSDARPMAVLQPLLELQVVDPPGPAPAGYVSCPVARLLRNGAAGWVLDPLFIPPLLCLAGHAGLLQQLQHLQTQLLAKRTRLMAMRRESHERMADFAVADVSLFWLLNALNSYAPVLAEFLEHPRWHPEPVYLELAKLAGSLLTFSLEHEPKGIPVYRHDALESVFPPLLNLIASLLESSLPSRVLRLELSARSRNAWQVALLDPRLREAAAVDLYLSVRSALPAVQLQAQFPGLCKAGAPDEVERMVNAALDGIPLLAVAQVPAAVPLRLGNQYFALDLAHPQGQAMLAAGTCVFHLVGNVADAQLELFAVLRA